MLERFPVGNGQIEVHLHRHIGPGPGRPLQVVDLLESEGAVSLPVSENEPIDIITRALIRGLVSWPVLEPEELSVELRQPSHIGRVENRLQYPRETGHEPRLTFDGHELWSSENTAGDVCVLRPWLST